MVWGNLSCLIVVATFLGSSIVAAKENESKAQQLAEKVKSGTDAASQFLEMVKKQQIGKKLGEYAGKLAKVLNGFGPVASAIAGIFDLIQGEQEDPYLREFQKLNQRFDELANQITNLGAEINANFNELKYGMVVRKVLSDLRAGSETLANGINKFSSDQFRSFCSSQPGVIRPLQATNQLSDIMKQAQQPPFWQALFDVTHYNLTAFEISVASMVNEVSQLGFYTQLCMVAVKDSRPNVQQMQDAATKTTQLLNQIDAALQQKTAQIKRDWYKNQLSIDLDSWLKGATGVSNGEFVKTIYAKLRSKYPFMDVTVYVYHHPKMVDAAGESVQDNDMYGGLVYRTNDDAEKGVAVFYRSQDAQPSDMVSKVEAMEAELERYDSWYTGIKETPVDSHCYYSAEKQANRIRSDPGILNLGAKHVFVVYLPKGGRTPGGMLDRIPKDVQFIGTKRNVATFFTKYCQAYEGTLGFNSNWPLAMQVVGF